MKCSRCGLVLAKGSAHINLESCLDSLVEALEQARACRECGDPVPVPLHAGCLAAHGAKGLAGLGATMAQQKVAEFVADKLSGRTSARKRTKAGRERFDPDA